MAAEAPFGADAAEDFVLYGSLLLASTLSILELDRSGTSRAVNRSLKRVDQALRSNSPSLALREIDRAWRSLEDDSDLLAPIYGRLLAFDDGDPDAALRLLQRIETPDPDVAALKARALLRLRRGNEAQEVLATALADFCVIPDELLSHVATEILDHPDMAVVGWIGLGPGLDFIGKLRGDDPAHALKITLGDGATFTQLIRPVSQNGHRDFRFALPQLLPGATVKVTCRGVPLLGSGLRISSDFSLDGRAASEDRRIAGWVHVGWNPKLPVNLCAETESGHRCSLQTRPIAQPGRRWCFMADLRQLGIRGNRLQLLALLPDGRWASLPDTPLILESALKLAGKSTVLGPWRAGVLDGRPKAAGKGAVATDVIIPVFRGLRETLDCISSALATVGNGRVVVVDDASEDVELAEALDALETSGHITLLRNATNLGFVGSVNRALARNRTRDAVLLNSDALVFGDWLERLKAAAYRAPNIGTVTPLSNSGTIASYPQIGEYPLSPDQASELHELASVTNAGLSQEIPVGVGFCLYIRRDCLREVGELDESVFGKGYGEETDFCLRARRLGWSHQLAADVFVYHAGGVSFGKRRMALMERSQRLLNLRYPGYHRHILNFMAQDPLNPLRRNLDEQRLAACGGPFVLLVTLALSGGVQRFVAERCREIRAQGMIPLVLRPHKPGNSRRCELWTDTVDVPNLRYSIPADLPKLETLLRRLNIDTVDIQHFLHIDPRVIDMVRSLGVPYDVFVHDYSWICPRITLIDGSGRYCGEPEVTVCEACVKRNGSNLGVKITVANLRTRSEEWLLGARRVLAPSADAALRLEKYFPVPIEVRAHSAPPETAAAERAAASNVTRVAILGAIGEHKGYKVLLNCARDAKFRALPLEFVVIGYTEDDGPLLETGKVFITGRYSEGEAAHLLRREKPDIAFLPSVWPETWCYVLDEAAAVGLKVVAFDLGAIAARIRDKEMGMVLPLGMEPRRINDRLVEIAAHAEVPDQHDALTAKETLDSHMNIKTPGRDSAQNEALSASVQVLPLPSGLYLFSVKAATPTSDRSLSQLRLPAMHVGLGPGVRTDQVEFVTGPATDGAWLFAQDDLLVTKVNGAGATLILTSVRAPGGEVLSIKVERLENRADEAGAVTAVATAASALPAAPAPKKSKAESVATSTDPVPLRISAHVRARGDMNFSDVPWAGRVAPGLWIESFSIKPLDLFEAKDIEYKGLTGSGFETPWLTDEKMCGTKGMSVPLVGFAVRLKAGHLSAAYDCEYSGFFKSGITVGPLRNGAPCRSTVASDPLEGIQVRICKRPGAAKAAGVTEKAARQRESTAQQPPANGKGPSFGRYRDSNGHAAKVANGTTTGKAGGAASRSGSTAKKAAPETRKASDSAAPNPRPIARRS